MKRIIYISNTILNDFGFSNIKTFINSVFTPRYGLLFASLSGLGSLGEVLFGMSNFTLLILVVLVQIELLTGIWAAKIRGRAIVSKKLQRFILKIMIYFLFIVVFHRLSEDSSNLTKYLYEYMHSFTIMYFIFVHLKSITENYERITGKKSELSKLIDILNSKIFSKDK